MRIQRTITIPAILALSAAGSITVDSPSSAHVAAALRTHMWG